MSRLPEAERHGTRVLADLSPPRRDEDHRRRQYLRVAADNGTEKVHAFCPTCGTPVHLTFTAAPDFIAVPAGGLDDPGRFAPQAVTYGVRGHAWDRLDPTLPKYERMAG